MSDGKGNDTCNCDKQKRIQYNKKHDAYYCITCDSWIEESCDDQTCKYCVDRPERPSQVTED